MRPLFAWGMLVLALLAWGAFGFAVLKMNSDRAGYVDAAIIAREESARGENATRLHSTIQSSAVERAALEGVVGVTILDAVETIEAAARDAGASEVKIGEASTQNTSAQKLSTVSVVLTASGSFIAIVRAVSLLETLPLPSVVESFEISKTETTWRLTTRLRVTLAAEK